MRCFDDHRFFFRLLAISLAFLFGYAQAQQRQIDSITNLLPKTEGISRIQALCELAYAYIDIDNMKALGLAMEARQKATVVNDTTLRVKAGRVAASSLRRLDRLDESIREGEEALQLAKQANLVQETKILLNSLAIGYMYQANYNKALELYFQSLAIRETSGTSAEVSICLNNIGLIFYKMENFQKALEYYTKSHLLKRSIRDMHDLDRLYINMALCHSELKNFDKAYEYVKLGQTSCVNGCSEQIQMEAAFVLGHALIGQKQFEAALTKFKTSLELAMRLDNKRFQADNLANIGMIYREINEWTLSKNHLLKSLELERTYGYRDLLLITYRELNRLSVKSRDFEQAVFYQNEYLALKDSILDASLVNKVAQVQADFQEKENLLHIESQAKILDLQKQVIYRQQLLNYSIIGVACLTLALLIFLYNNYKQKQQINGILDKRVKERTIELEENRDELRKLNDIKSLELKNLSDELVASIASIKGFLDLLELDTTQRKTYITRMHSILQKLTSTVRPRSGTDP